MLHLSNIFNRPSRILKLQKILYYFNNIQKINLPVSRFLFSSDCCQMSVASKSSSQAPQILGADLVNADKTSSYFQERNQIFEKLYKKYNEYLKGLPRQPIKVTLPDGKVVQGTSFQTTPLQIAKGISNSLASSIVVAKVLYSKKVVESNHQIIDPDENIQGHHVIEHHPGHQKEVEQLAKYQTIDLTRPLQGDCKIELLKFDSPQGRHTFWHSSAHVLGGALQSYLDRCYLTHGPPIQHGFFYDSFTADKSIHPSELKDIEKKAKELISKKASFQRVELSKQEALQLFKYNPFKVELIKKKVPQGSITSAYRCGSLIDLCTGPHLQHTGVVKAIKLTKNSSSYWLAKATNDTLQRVYGISFPVKDQLEKYIKFQEEAAAKDHRLLGRQQNLFDFHILSPGSAFFSPNGTHIYNTLIDLMRKQYKVRGYHEIISPNVYNIRLWKVSGHYQNYLKQGFGIKPMNCPGHCLLFDSQLRSYRDMPIRWAEFGVLHRNEISGALHGLTRVRRFQQDDAHLFCMESQIEEQVLGCLDFLGYVYSLFGFQFTLALGTRPQNYLGANDLWQKAEGGLKKALDIFGKDWTTNEGDGAFYGPKIDIHLKDALQRSHQCGTIQLDFQLPVRFNLQYRTSQATQDSEQSESQLSEASHESHNIADEGQVFPADEYDQQQFSWNHGKLKPGFARPVIIHRAILGSLERFIAIITEQTGGKWPFWISPRQLMICPLSQKFIDYATQLYHRFQKEGFMAGLDQSSVTLNKKIRNAQLDHWNFILVVGPDELEGKTADVRTRDNRRLGKIKVSKLIKYFRIQNEVPKSKASEKFQGASFYDQQELIQIKKIHQQVEKNATQFKDIIQQSKQIKFQEEEKNEQKGGKQKKQQQQQQKKMKQKINEPIEGKKDGEDSKINNQKTAQQQQQLEHKQ